MLLDLKFGGVLAALVCIAVDATLVTASALTVEVAKKCEALTIQAFPPLEPGNPALGSAKGSAAAERSYYRKCIANGGNIEGPSPGASPANPALTK